MNRKQVQALKSGDIVKGWRDGSGKHYPFEFEVLSNEVEIIGASPTIKVKTMAWPQMLSYKWYMPPMCFEIGRYPGSGNPIYRGYEPDRDSWEVGKEVFVETRYLRDVDADAERARVASEQRERQEEAARRERFAGRRGPWADWFGERGAEQGTAYRGAGPIFMVNVTPHEAFELIKDLRVETRFTMVFAMVRAGEANRHNKGDDSEH